MPKLFDFTPICFYVLMYKYITTSKQILQQYKERQLYTGFEIPNHC